jgi:hypothetical protein
VRRGYGDWINRWAAKYIAIKTITRDEMAEIYAKAIIESRRRAWSGCNWPELNQAIQERWSRSGLLYIKRRAHKKLEADERGGL